MIKKRILSIVMILSMLISQTSIVRGATVGKKAKAVYSGVSISIVVDTQDNLWIWGDSRDMFYKSSKSPYKPLKIMSNVKKVDYVYYSHFYVTKKDNSLWALGYDVNSILHTTPKKISNKVKAYEYISTAAAYFLKTDNTLWKWNGKSSTKILSNVSSFDYPHAILKDNSLYDYIHKTNVTTNVSRIEDGYIIKKDNSLWQLSNPFVSPKPSPSPDPSASPSPTTTPLLEDVKNVYTEGGTSYAIKKDGSLWTWGNNKDGNVGDNTTTKRNVPIKVLDGPIVNISFNLDQGGSRPVYTTYAIDKEGKLWSWGANSNGQVGNGTTKVQKEPICIARNALKMTAAYGTACLIKKDGSLWSWGWNKFGSVGNGTKTNVLKPKRVLNDVSYVSIERPTIAIKKDGSLWIWGDNYNGEVGNGKTKTYQLKPYKTLTNVKSVRNNLCTLFAIKKDGSLYGWGDNSSGMIGDGTQKNRSKPVKVILK